MGVEAAYETFLAPKGGTGGGNESQEDKALRFRREADELNAYNIATEEEWFAYRAVTAATRERYATAVAPILLAALRVAARQPAR